MMQIDILATSENSSKWRFIHSCAYQYFLVMELEIVEEKEQDFIHKLKMQY